MNIPKAIRSLKSKCLLFISTTPILCKNRGLPPCNTVVLSKSISCQLLTCNLFIYYKNLYNKFGFIQYIRNNSATILSSCSRSVQSSSIFLAKIVPMSYSVSNCVYNFDSLFLFQFCL